MFWKEEYYQYIVLCNGFSPAARVFTKVSTPPFKYLRSKGHLSIKYTDDSLLQGETFEICFKNIRATVALLRELGFTIHSEKAVLIPTQQIIFLFSVQMTLTLTEEREQSIYMFFQSILSNYQATIRDLAQTIGVIVSSFTAVPYDQINYRVFENAKYSPWLDLAAILIGTLPSQRKQSINENGG